MRFRALASALLFATLISAAAYGDTTSGSGGGFSGSGMLVTTDNGNGSYTIVDITGSGLTGILTQGSFNGNDNQLFPSGASVVDGSGFAFGYAQGDTNYDVNVFSAATGSYSAFLSDSDQFSETIPVSLSVVDPPCPVGFSCFDFNVEPAAATPEPSGLMLLGTGLAGIGGMLRRRR